MCQPAADWPCDTYNCETSIVRFHTARCGRVRLPLEHGTSTKRHVDDILYCFFKQLYSPHLANLLQVSPGAQAPGQFSLQVRSFSRLVRQAAKQRGLQDEPCTTLPTCGGCHTSSCMGSAEHGLLCNHAACHQRVEVLTAGRGVPSAFKAVVTHATIRAGGALLELV